MKPNITTLRYETFLILILKLLNVLRYPWVYWTVSDSMANGVEDEEPDDSQVGLVATQVPD